MEDPTITDGKITITEKDLVPYIVKQGEDLYKRIKDAKQKYGSRYNRKNKIEEMYYHFGNPMYIAHAQKFAKEYMLILQKKSTLPAAIRYPVREICDSAMKSCYMKKMEVELRKPKMRGHLGTEQGNKVTDVLVDIKNKEKNDQ